MKKLVSLTFIVLFSIGLSNLYAIKVTGAGCVGKSGECTITSGGVTISSHGNAVLINVEK